MKNLLRKKLVKGSGEEYYEVTYERFEGNEYWSCTCPSFKYRPEDCKHIKQLKESLDFVNGCDRICA
jgi:hypothetical protein